MLYSSYTEQQKMKSRIFLNIKNYFYNSNGTRQEIIFFNLSTNTSAHGPKCCVNYTMCSTRKKKLLNGCGEKWAKNAEALERKTIKKNKCPGGEHPSNNASVRHSRYIWSVELIVLIKYQRFKRCEFNIIFLNSDVQKKSALKSI